MTTPRPLRVVVVGPPLAASGGIGRVMSYTLAALADDEVAVRVLDTRGLRSSPWFSVVQLLRSCAILFRLGVRRQADVVHVNISSHGSALRKGLVVRVCRLVGLPVVLHLHASSFPEFYAPLPGWARRWVGNTFRMATRVIVLAEVWRRYAQDVLGVSSECVSVLPNATPAAVTAASARTPGEALSIVFLGRLGPRKGVPELLEALADPRLREHSWRATCAGDGDVDGYRARGVELGLEDRIAFPGWVGTEAVGELLADSHVLVLPSHAEGSPMSVLEAFAAGVPVICTPVGGLSEVVVERGNGLLVLPGDVQPLADALLELIEDESLRSELSVGALSTWRRFHSIEGYATRLMNQWRLAASRTPTASKGAGRVPALGGG